MTKLDVLGGRAAAQLRTAVGAHLEDHPTPVPRPPRVPRGAVAALALILVVALGATVVGNSAGDGPNVQTAGESESSSAKQLDTTGRDEGRLDVGGDDAAIPGAGSTDSNRPTSGGRQATTPSTIAGQDAAAGASRNEPPSRKSMFGTCSTTVQGPGTITPSEKWCVNGYSQGRTPEGHLFVAHTCREAGARDEVLRYPWRQEADYLITDLEGREVWRWTRTRTMVDYPHQETVKSGGCVTWEVLWDERDPSGAKVKPGEYRLSVMVLADGLMDEWTPADQAVNVK